MAESVPSIPITPLAQHLMGFAMVGCHQRSPRGGTFILWILSPNKVQPLEKSVTQPCQSIDVFWEKSNRTYRETKVIECFRDFENIPLCLEMYDMLVRYNFDFNFFLHLPFPGILSSKDLKVWRLSLFQYMHLFPCIQTTPFQLMKIDPFPKSYYGCGSGHIIVLVVFHLVQANNLVHNSHISVDIS